MHVQAFVSRVVRMPASGVKSPIATSSVKRTRQLLQGRKVLERVEASNVYSLRPRSRKLLQFLSRVSVGCTTQERTGLGTGDRLGKQGAETRSSVVFGRFHHGHSWQGCSRQEDLTRALSGQRCQRNLFCEYAVLNKIITTYIYPLAFNHYAHQKKKNRGHDFPSQTRTAMRGSSCDVRVRQPRQRVGRRPPKEECPLAGGSTHCRSCTKQLQDKVPERHMEVTAQGPTSDHFVH